MNQRFSQKLGLVIASALLCATAAQADERLDKGKSLAMNKAKGNCLACHMIADGDLPGTIGPPLLSMQARFPNKADLRSQVYDARQRNPHTVMPPYGANGLLTEEEIDLIVDYIYSL